MSIPYTETKNEAGEVTAIQGKIQSSDLGLAIMSVFAGDPDAILTLTLEDGVLQMELSTKNETGDEA